MSIATQRAPTILSAADLPELIDRLGRIDPARVRLRPPPGTATEADLVRVVETKSGPLCELVEGTLVDKVMSVEEASIESNLIALLHDFVRPRRIGVVLPADAMQRLAPGIVRLPDVSVIHPAKWREWRRTRPAVGNFGPDLAVEVLSKKNTLREMARKRHEYFASGTQLVWEIHPRRRTVTVFTSPSASTKLTESDTLTGGSVLPGFKVRVADLFKDPLDD